MVCGDEFATVHLLYHILVLRQWKTSFSIQFLSWKKLPIGNLKKVFFKKPFKI